MPEQLEESSIADDTPMQYDGASLPTVTTYQVIEDGSQKGKEKLVDSLGYTYTPIGDAAYEVNLYGAKRLS